MAGARKMRASVPQCPPSFVPAIGVYCQAVACARMRDSALLHHAAAGSNVKRRACCFSSPAQAPVGERSTIYEVRQACCATRGEFAGSARGFTLRVQRMARAQTSPC